MSEPIRPDDPRLAPVGGEALPEGVTMQATAPADVIRRLGWDWYIHGVGTYICRPPQAAPITVGNETLPATATDEQIVAAFRAAGGEA